MSSEQAQRLTKIEQEGDKYCTNTAEECKLTKKEMCEKIVYHYLVVNNLLATIISVVPLPSDKGEYAGGFIFDRLSSLKKGNFCLPYHSEIESITDDERLHKIFKYINILSDRNTTQEQACKNNNGFFLKLSKENMEQLSRDENFGRKYFDFAKKINIFYQEALINLYNILDNLQNNTAISTRRLNQLSEQTKKIIDELYLKTQFNYLLAILVILEVDFTKTSSELIAKKRRKEWILQH